MRWAIGDGTGLAIPADPETLRHAGPDFLTTAMRRFGTLDADNKVDRITRFEECGGGSTGRKALLDVEYARAQPGLRTELFVKFSRDFDHPRRDRGKSQMELEIGFAALSARTELPVAVPVCAFGDYHRESCTGLLLTERIGYGTAPIEPHYEKCRDYQMPDTPGHYAALLTAVARLAGAHRGGRLPSTVDEQFRFDAEKVTVGKRIRYPADALLSRVHRIVAFGNEHPDLLPAVSGHGTAFTDRMLTEVTRIAAAEDSVMGRLHRTDAHIALCHWNANVDNAWLWRSPAGTLHCGLMDWGCVSVMNVAMALWGSLCSAETELWEHHLDDLLARFGAEYARSGGPDLDPETLRAQLGLYAVVMGVAWLLDTPANVSAAVPDLAEVSGRRDPRIAENESVRAPLLMLNNVLHVWATEDVGALLDALGSR